MDLFLGVGLVVGGLGDDVVFGVMAFAYGVGWQFVGRVHVGLELIHHQTSFHHYKIISNIIIVVMEEEEESIKSGLIGLYSYIRWSDKSKYSEMYDQSPLFSQVCHFESDLAVQCSCQSFI